MTRKNPRTIAGSEPFNNIASGMIGMQIRQI
jgi:hypothetical protein